MGFNTAVIICNDQLDRLVTDPDAGKVIGDAISEANYGFRIDGARRSGAAAYGRHGIGALPSRHADDCQLVLIGHNSIQLVGQCWTGDPLEAVRQVANQLGYDLRKKPERKSA
jgi:hypothetical protein